MIHLFKLAAPETIVVITALVVLFVDLSTLRDLELRTRLFVSAMIACAGCIAAVAWTLIVPVHDNLYHGLMVVDPLTQFIKCVLLALAAFTVLISVDAQPTHHVGEYFALVLLAAVGTMFLVSTEDILMIFISLELTSLSLYILTAFNKRNPQSAEAAMKYFLFGGMAAAFTLFGLSLLYGISGSTNLGDIAKGAADRAIHLVKSGAGVPRTVLDPLLIVAIVTTVIGFGFKVAAAPFHLWAPDAYQGAPVPSAAFIASASKVASFFVFAKVMTLGFAGAEGSGAWRHFLAGWTPVLAVVAAVSMVLGNLAAIVQSSVRRLLAYSAIAHAGYMLLAIMAGGNQSIASLVYYVVTYAVTALGAFGVVAVVQDLSGGDRLTDFAGLSRRAPVPAFCMMVFMLSLAGIPPLAGFFGKFYLFATAAGSDSGHLGLLWLVVLAIGMSAVSLYYYLQVLKQIYVADAPAAQASTSARVISQILLAVLAVTVVALGCAPNLLVERLLTAIKLCSG